MKTKLFVLILALLLCSLNAHATTQEEATTAITHAKTLQQELQKANFTTNHISDLIFEAERHYEIAKKLDILSNSTNKEERRKIMKELELVNTFNISYTSVLYITSQIDEERSKAYLTSDLLTAVKENIDYYQTKNITIVEAQGYYQEAQEHFMNERYTEAQEALIKTQEVLEKAQTDASTLGILQKGAKTTIQNYWKEITLFLIIIIVITITTIILTQERRKQNKIKKLKNELQALQELIKKAQIEHYKEKKISGFVYNIRLKKYQERIEIINAEIPTLEKKKIKKNLKETS